MEAGTRCFYLPSTLSSGQLHSLHKTPGPCVPVVTSEDLNKRDSLGNAVLLGSQMWGIFLSTLLVCYSRIGSAVLGEMLFLP